MIAALVAAGAFVVLVILLAIPLLKLGRTLDEATIALRKAHEGSAPLLDCLQYYRNTAARCLRTRTHGKQRPHQTRRGCACQIGNRSACA